MANVVNLNLDDYVNQNRDQLFIESTIGARTLDYVEVMLGVKWKEELHYLDSEVVIKDATCDWDPDGADNFGKRFIETHPLSVQKEFCPLDMQKKYMNYQLLYEAGRLSEPFQEAITRSNIEAVKKELENILWQGSASASVTGFLADIAEASATSVSVGSGATAVEAIDAVVAAATPKMLAKGVNVFLSYTDFRNYVQASNSSCCSNRPVLDAASDSITYAGDSRVKLIPVMGLEGTNHIVAATPDALVYGTDINGAETELRWFHDDKTRKECFEILFAAGTAVKYPDEIVIL